MEVRPSQIHRFTVAAFVAAIVLAACQPAVAPTGTAPVAGTPLAVPTPAPTASDQVPALVDIPMYKATPGRTGVHPGPGPITEPVEAWSTSIGCLVGDRTPALASGMLLVTCDAPKLVALDARSGKVRWTAELAAPGLSTPSVADGIAYLGTSGKTFEAFELATGARRWSIPLDTKRLSATADGRVYVGVADGRYVGLDPTDGSVDWTWVSPKGDDDLGGTVVDGFAYVSGSAGQLYAIRLADASTVWSIQGSADRLSLPAVTGDSVVVGSQPVAPLIALDRATGTERWRYAGPSGEQIAPASVADGVVFAPSASDGLFAFNLTTGEVLWRGDTGPMGGQAVAISGDLVYVTADRGVQAYDRTTGRRLWSIDLGASVDNSSLVSGGMIFTANNNGFVRAFAERPLVALLKAAAPSATAMPSTGPSAGPSASPPSLLALDSTLDPTTGVRIDQPSGIDVGPDGNLYVVSALTDEIVVLSPADWSVVRRWGRHGSRPGEFNFLREPADTGSALGGVAVSHDGTVYVADPVNRRVQAFTSAGKFVRSWGRFGSADGQFLEPIDVAVGPDGDVYVVDDKRDDIQRFRANGTYRSTIGEHGVGPGQMNFTSNIDIGADGTLVNADWDNHRVQAWDADGAFRWTTEGGFRTPTDVAVDDGLVFASDRGGLQVLGKEGVALEKLRFSDSELVFLATDGTWLYTAESFLDRIVRYRIVR